MRCIALFLAVQISISAASAVALPAPSESEPSIPASTAIITALRPTQEIHIELSATATATATTTSSSPPPSSSSSSSAKSTPLFLPVTGAQPDPLGIANVSGIYGPGAWAAWFLTVVASWVRILRTSKGNVDVNTALFLLGTNWAAIDVFRSIHAMRSLQPSLPDYESSFTKCMGSYGAAFTVLFWGTIHALLQIPSTGTFFGDTDLASRRLRILAVGLVLPLIALTATAFGPVVTGLEGTAIGLIPVLYWKGMDDTTHGPLFILAAGTAIFLVPILILGWTEYEDLLPDYLTRIASSIGNWLANSKFLKTVLLTFFMGSFASAILSILVCIITANSTWLWGMAPFGLLTSGIFLLLGFVVWIMCISCGVVVYIFKGYLHLGSNASESCFFMPCAPQSMADEDQIYALLSGLFAFFAFEALPHAIKEIKTRYRERRLFVQDIEGRLRQFEMRRRMGPDPRS